MRHPQGPPGFVPFENPTGPREVQLSCLFQTACVDCRGTLLIGGGTCCPPAAFTAHLFSCHFFLHALLQPFLSPLLCARSCHRSREREDEHTGPNRVIPTGTPVESAVEAEELCGHLLEASPRICRKSQGCGEAIWSSFPCLRELGNEDKGSSSAESGRSLSAKLCWGRADWWV